MRKKSYYILFFLLPLIFVTNVEAEHSPPPPQLNGIIQVIGKIIALLAPIAGIAFLAMFIYGGFQLMMSGGDPKAAAAARNTFMFAIAGIILVVIVWLLLLLIKNVTGVDVTTVSFPFAN